MTLMVSNDEFSWTAPVHKSKNEGRHLYGTSMRILCPKPCSEKRMPPAKKHMPRTRTAPALIKFGMGRRKYIRRLLRIDPTTEGNCESRVAWEGINRTYRKTGRL
jgi:hypothetical protein